MSSLQWVDKYKPKTVNDIIGNKLQIKQIFDWLKVFTGEIKPKKDFKNGLLISGSPGIGKTSSIHIILRYFGFNVIEYNASELRTSKIISEKLNTILSGKSIQMMFNKTIKTGIIMDEADGIESKKECSSSDIIDYLNYSYNQYIAKLKRAKIKVSKKNITKIFVNNNPIICICNTINKSISPLLPYVVHVPFNIPTDKDILDILTKINIGESLNISPPILNLIVPHCQGDLRRSVYLLEYLSNFIKKEPDMSGTKLLELINNLGSKDMDVGLTEAIRNIFYVYDNSLETILQGYYSETNFVPFIVHENFINFIDKNTNETYESKLDICSSYYDKLIGAQVFKNNMFGNWHMTEYIGFMTCYYPNILIKNCKLKQTPVYTKTEKSALISKYNYRYYNLKSINYLCKKLSVDILNFQILSAIIIHGVFYSPKFVDNFIPFLNSKNITFKEFEKIMKLSPCFENYSKQWNKNYQKELMCKFDDI